MTDGEARRDQDRLTFSNRARFDKHAHSRHRMITSIASTATSTIARTATSTIATATTALARACQG